MPELPELYRTQLSLLINNLHFKTKIYLISNLPNYKIKIPSGRDLELITMLEKKTFIAILNSAEKIERTVCNIESTFDINMEDGSLMRAFSTLMDVLMNECHIDYTDSTEKQPEPVIYEYAITNDWGQVEQHYKIGDRCFKVNSPESLYEYVVAKYNYDLARDMEDTLNAITETYCN
jgi:hypothetical protein